MKLWWN